jgi:hypothetical protein
MHTLETLATPHGRSLLRDIYRDLRFEKHVGAISTLGMLWRICTLERDLFRTVNRDVTVLHPLGMLRGTGLWMQEIVNRYFYSAINAFVYIGAAFLLVAIGLNRTGIINTPSVVVAAIVVEASLLVLLFAVMFFSPPDDDLVIDGGADGEVSQELLRELGEIGRDYAAMAVQLEAIAGTLQDVVDRQNDMTESMRISVQAAVEAVAPNPNLMKSMSETTAALSAFTTSIDALRERLQAVERQEVERLVRNELEKLLSRNIVERDGQGR